MYFTKEDFQAIERYLKTQGKKDTDFEDINPLDIQPEDIFAIVHAGKNIKIPIESLFKSPAAQEFINTQLDTIQQYINSLQQYLAFIRGLIDEIQVDKVGVVTSLGNSNTLAVAQSTVTDALKTIDDTEISTVDKVISTKYRKIKTWSDNGTKEYIIPTVTMTDVYFPKVWFNGSDTTMSNEELLDLIDSPYSKTSFTYTKQVSNTNYYVIVEPEHSLTKVTNTVGFDYTSSFTPTTIAKDSQTYNVYHYQRAINPTITLNFEVQ